jgi:hypothetical protein
VYIQTNKNTSLLKGAYTMMSKKEKDLAAMFLQVASSAFSHNICNDVPEKIFKEWTKEERIKLVREYYIWNGDPDEFSESHLHIPDFALMSFLAHKLENEV